MTEQIIVQLNPDVPPTGSDLGVVNAARKSFGRRSEWDIYNSVGALLNEDPLKHLHLNFTKLKPKDKRLLEFLARGMTADDFDSLLYEFGETDLSKHPELLWEWRNTPTHDTPFNHGFFSFEVKAPIFVARHLVKHEYLIMSEYSRRYITDDVEFYRHDYRIKAGNVKQGSGGLHPLSDSWQRDIEMANREAVRKYDLMIKDGIAPEQARGHLPQDLMTSWTWSGTLGAFGNMCKLRLSRDTQYETRVVAQAVYDELKKQFPVSAPLLVEGVY